MPRVPASIQVTNRQYQHVANQVVLPTFEVPYARNSDTSKEAAESMRDHVSGIAQSILSHIRRGSGATCDEVEIALDLTHQTASARINWLRNQGYLIDSKARRLTRSGRKAVVWHAIPEGWTPTPPARP